jgi:hypothetical protein
MKPLYQRQRSNANLINLSPICSSLFVATVVATYTLTACGQGMMRTHLEVGRGVVVTAKVNHQPIQLCLDTGLGGPIVLSATVAKNLRLPLGISTTLSDPSGNGSISVLTTKIESVEIAGATFTSLDAAIQPDSPMMEDCAGVVGLDLFKDYVATVDLAHGELRLDHTKLSADQPDVIPYASDHGVPQIQIRVGKQLLPAHLDTMGRGLSLPESELAILHLSTPPTSIGMGHTVSGDFEIKGAVVDDTIQVGSYSFQGSFVEFTSHFSTVNVGLAALRTFTLRFDSARHLVQIESSEPHVVIHAPRVGRVPVGQPIP